MQRGNGGEAGGRAKIPQSYGGPTDGERVTNYQREQPFARYELNVAMTFKKCSTQFAGAARVYEQAG